MSAKDVTIVFNTLDGFQCDYTVYGYASSGASGVIVAQGTASGVAQTTIVVSGGFQSYRLAARQGGAHWQPLPGFASDAEVLMVFEAIA